MKEKIHAMIPARIGSERLKYKNLALLNERPLIYYAINAAKNSKVFNKIIINSDHEIFSEIAKRYGVSFYKRPKSLGGSKIKSDLIVYDFISSFNDADIICWVNPIAPLQTSEEIRTLTKYFLDQNLDSLITVESKQLHSMYMGKPMNFDMEELFKRTQELCPIDLFVYTTMMWRVDTFKKTYEEKGFAFFCGKFGVFPVSRLASIIVKTAKDIQLVEYIIKSEDSSTDKKIEYDNLIDKIID